ncbi:hypothetical protein GC170_13830 [bacterium]|nr:hypothetical protein [bacterium]
MSEPHKIRLRGGWTIGPQDSAERWTLPCQGLALASHGDSVSFTRRFNHPPLKSGSQVCRLVLRQVAGVTQVDIDGQKFTPAMPVIDHPEAGFDFELPPGPGHRVVLSVDTAAASEAPEWGHIWLEIAEETEST